MIGDVVLLQLLTSIYETIYMTFISTVFILIFGVILGVILYLTSPGNLLENRFVYKALSSVIDLFRSIPFIILLILLIPFTKVIMGTMLGMNAALPSLVIGATPFYSRIVESALREVNKGTVEAVQSMGANLSEIVTKVLLRESLPALLSGITLTSISIVSYSAMAGVIGAGGLGNYAYLYGFQRNNWQVVIASTISILFIVLTIQKLGNYLVEKIDHRK